MTFWIIAAIVLVALLVIAWLTSGRSRPGGTSGRSADHDSMRAQVDLHRGTNLNGPTGPPRF